MNYKIRVMNITPRHERPGVPSTIQMGVCIESLKSKPIIFIELTADEAIDLALAALKAVNQTRGRLKERSA